MRVELIRSHAEVSNNRVAVELATRVTLSSTLGKAFLGQTHGYCKQSEVIAPGPTAAVYACMDGMAHDLAGWLEGIQP